MPNNEIEQISGIIDFIIRRAEAYWNVFLTIPMMKEEEIRNIFHIFTVGRVPRPDELIREWLANPAKEAKLYRLLGAIVETCYRFEKIDVLKGCSEEFKNKIFAFRFGDASI